MKISLRVRFWMEKITDFEMKKNTTRQILKQIFFVLSDFE